MNCISLKVLLASMFLNLLAMPINSGAAVIFGYVSLLASVSLPIELMLHNGVYINKKQFYITLAFLIIVSINSLLSLFAIKNEELESFIKALISFFAFLLSISAKDVVYTEKDLKFYYLITRVFSIIMILYTVLPFDFQYVAVNEYGNKEFTLSMGNPNATATKILFAIIVLCIEVITRKRIILRCFDVVLISGLVNIIVRLRSRTALICSIIFLVYALFLRFPIKKWMANWVWVIPVVFIPIQIMLKERPLWGMLDKTFASGREELFADYLELISSSPMQFVLGDFAQNQLANTHNIIFALIFNFGFVGVALYLYFWRVESKALNNASNSTAKLAWMGWIVFVIHSMAEAAALSGAFTFGAIIIFLNRLTKDTVITEKTIQDKV